MKNMRKEIKWALLCTAIHLFLSRFDIVPNFVLGVLCGLGICFFILGLIPEKNLLKFKNYKKKAFLTLVNHK